MRNKIGLAKNSPFIIFQTLLRKIPFRPVVMDRFYLLSFEGIPVVTRVRGRGEVREGTLDDLDQMAELENKWDIFSNRFRRGDCCCVALIDGKIVGYEWFSNESYHIEERCFYRINIPVDSIYAYDAYILPEHRISGIWLKFKGYLANLMKELGKKRVITLMDYGNTLSINTHVRFGFKPFKSVLFIKILGKNFFKETNIIRQ